MTNEIEKGVGRATGILRDLGLLVVDGIAVVIVTETETTEGGRNPVMSGATGAKTTLNLMPAARVQTVEVGRRQTRAAKAAPTK